MTHRYWTDAIAFTLIGMAFSACMAGHWYLAVLPLAWGLALLKGD